MKYYIEEAIIVETYETEPKITVETVQPEIINDQRRRRRRRSGGLFSSFFDDLLGLFFDDNDYRQEEYYSTPVKEAVVPETALIVETNERKVQEIQYFYAEIIN